MSITNPHGHKQCIHKLWSSKAMQAHSNRIWSRRLTQWRRLDDKRKRKRNYSFINVRRALLIHRVEMEVEVEKMMEEAIAKSLKA